jgi:hypothetical protein
VNFSLTSNFYRSQISRATAGVKFLLLSNCGSCKLELGAVKFSVWQLQAAIKPRCQIFSNIGAAT